MGEILRANIRRQKGSFIGITLLVLITTVLLCAVIGVWKNSMDYEEEQLERLHYGDLLIWMYENPIEEELIGQLKGAEGVGEVISQEMIYSNYQINGTESSNILFCIPYDPDVWDFHFFTDELDGISEEETKIPDGSCYVPAAFYDTFDARIGDEVVLLLDEDKELPLRIAGWFEDPESGSSLMGMKNILVNGSEYERLLGQISDAGQAAPVTRLEIFADEAGGITVNEMQQNINQDTDVLAYAQMSYQTRQLANMMTMIQSIFAGVLILFAVVLLVVAMVVLGHSISSHMEQDYVNMGILKAVGYNNGHLRRLQIAQYMIAAGAGMLLGIPLSIPVMGLVSSMTITATGLCMPAVLPIELCLPVLLVIVAVLLLFIYGKTARLRRITPIRAIRGGIGDVYFKSRAHTPVCRKGLHFWLSLRQLISGKKQYISTGLVSVLLVFFLSLVGRLDAWVGEDGEGIMKSLDVAEYDVGIISEGDHVTREEWEQVIREYSGIQAAYRIRMTTAALNGMNYTMYFCDDPSRYKLLQGRTCRYANEILVTDFVAEDLGLEIGDTVVVGYGDYQEEYVVSGIYQCANDLGANFAMSFDGFSRVDSARAELWNSYWYYQLADASKTQEVIEALEDRFGEDVATDTAGWSGASAIVSGMDALIPLMYVVVVVFILTTISMSGSKILFRERRDLGIYKSLGFSDRMLRLAFALRFGMVSVIGSLLGMVSSALLTDSLAGALLRMCGISRFVSHLNPWEMMWPAILVTLLFVAFAYLVARSIRRAELTILIAE